MNGSHHTHQRGFTLIEVLAALVIVGLGMLAVIEAISQTVNNADYIRQKTIAHWVAMNKLTEFRLSNAAPKNGESDAYINMAGSTWHWRMNISETDVKSMQRIDIHVSPKDSDSNSIASVYGFYSTAINVNSNRIEWDTGPERRAGSGSSSSTGSAYSSSSSSASSENNNGENTDGEGST
jgi:general secretion pathway protein I